ncbi:hypothetical protein N6H14_05795 [Paenibacillus sp. CC-CFT747]|nr:hypothetical protein N6H14_05795 [Paenibacillus sp. CC-CFT747]
MRNPKAVPSLNEVSFFCHAKKAERDTISRSAFFTLRLQPLHQLDGVA